MFQADTVVTGGTGLIGRWLVPELTRLGRDVLVLIRGADEREADYLRWVDALGGDASRVRVSDIDLTSNDLGVRDVNVSGVSDVFHLAARYEFGMDHDMARQTNVEGSLRVLHWSAAIPALRRLVFVTGYLGGVHADEIIAAPVDAQQGLIDRHYSVHGAYEASKVEENIVLQRHAASLGVPYTVINPSAVIGDSVTGQTTQFIGPSDLVRDLYFGKLPALVGDERIFLPMVTVDYVAQFMARVVAYPEAENQSYWLLDQHTPTLHRLIAEMAAHMGVAPPSLKVPKPIVSLLPGWLTGVEKETLSFLVSLSYDTTNAEALALAMGIQMPNITQSLRRWVDFLVSSQFGSGEPLPRGHYAPVGAAQTYRVGDVSTAQVLMLHGLPLDSESWQGVEQALTVASARVDLPGQGRNGEMVGGPVLWMEDLLKGSAQNPLIVAHSLGCEYALRYAKAHPEKVGGLVLISPFFLQSRAPWHLRKPWLLSSIAGMLGAPRFISSATGVDVGSGAAVSSTALSFGRPGKRLAFAKALSAGSAVDLRDELSAMLVELVAEQEGRLSVTLVVGETDPLIRPSAVGQVLEVRGADHYPQLTHAKAVAQIVESVYASTVSIGDPVVPDSAQKESVAESIT